MNDLKILLADDHPILLKGLVSFLSEKGYSNILSAGNGSDAWELIRKHEPEIGILDIEMPGLTGLEILKLCQNANLQTKIILLSYHNEPEFIALARQQGVAGYLGKENTIKEIEDCIHMVHHEGFYFPDNLGGEYMGPGKDIIRELSTLSARERQVLYLVSGGFTNKKIASRLDISLRTVEKHRSNIISKLKIHEKESGLSQWAIRNKTLLKDTL